MASQVDDELFGVPMFSPGDRPRDPFRRAMSALSIRDRLRPCRIALLTGCLLSVAVPPELCADDGLDNDLAEAAAGDPQALVRMAERYEMADGVPFDLGTASTFLELAARRGDAAAQYRLGLLQAGGLDPDADLADAYGWLRLAARAAEDAPTGLLAGAISETLAERLDSEAIERVEQEVAAFQPATGPAELPMTGADRADGNDRATLVAMLPATGCGAAEMQRNEQGDTVLLAYAPTGSMVDAKITPALRADLARRGAALDVAELSPAVCMIRETVAGAATERAASEVSLAGVAEGTPARLRDGDMLVIDLMAADEPRYVVVDYVVQTGEVWHLYPGEGEDGYLPAGQALRLGDGADGPAWEVGAPFGDDLVLVTLSGLPLPSDQPVSERADAYRARLQQRLQAAPSGSPFRLFTQVVTIEGP
jgi:hypothetical protein